MTIEGLSDIRFKLLAFVPTLAGVAIALINDNKVSQFTALALGILGFFVTLGIIMYELRNTLFYEMSAARASRLEALLKLPRFSLPERSDQPGGMFKERAAEGPQKLIGIIPVRHDRGLALIYGASLGGWVYIAVSTLLPKSETYNVLSLIIAGVVATLTGIQFIILDNERSKWRENNLKDYNLYRGEEAISALSQKPSHEQKPDLTSNWTLEER